MLDFLFLYEIDTRELENIFLVGAELERRGYSVDYLSFYNSNRNKYLNNIKTIKKFFGKVKVLVVPSFYDDYELFKNFYYVVGRCNFIVNLRWEQCFSNKNMEPADSNLLYPHESAKCAIHVCWGMLSFDKLKKAGIDENNLWLTGPLHMDLLRPEFKEYFLSRDKLLEKYNIETNRKVLLYISSFSRAHLGYEMFNKNEKDLNLDRKLKVDDWVALEYKSYLTTIEWFKHYLKKYPETTIVYRPHPTELLTDKLTELMGCKNFKIITDYSVKQWILACEIVCTWISTSLAEAFFANKACYIIRPYKIPDLNDICIYNNAEFVSTLDEFLLIDSQKTSFSVDINVIKEAYDYDFNTASYLRLTKKLMELNNSDRDGFPWDMKKVVRFELCRPFYFIKSIVTNFYYFCLKLSLFFYRKYNVPFFGNWKNRVIRYDLLEKKRLYGKVTDYFLEVKNKVYPLVKQNNDG